MRGAPGPERWLPLAIVATAFVVILPALAVWAIVPPGEVALLAVSVPLGMLLSVLAAQPRHRAVEAHAGLARHGVRRPDAVGLAAPLAHRAPPRPRRDAARRRRPEPELEALTELSALLEARDSYTYGHSQRVTRHAERIARALGLSRRRRREGPHRRRAARRGQAPHAARDPQQARAPHRRGVRGHPPPPGRRRRDGQRPRRPDDRRHDPPPPRAARRRRLPRGPVGDAIPLGARIIAVADTFDAMTSHRAYRRASSHKRALDVLRAGSREATRRRRGRRLPRLLPRPAHGRVVGVRDRGAAALLRLARRLSPGISAGAAGAAAVLIGLGSPPAPVISAGSAALPRVTDRADAGPRPRQTDVAERGPRRFVRTAFVERPVPRRTGTVAPRKRAVAACRSRSRRRPPPTRRPRRARRTRRRRPRSRHRARPLRPPPRRRRADDAHGSRRSRAGGRAPGGRSCPTVELPAVELPACELPPLEVRLP